MNVDQARATVAEVLGQVAPEADLSDVEPDEDLRTGLDLDSLDFLSVVEHVKERTGVDIPEADYPSVRTLAGMTAYLVARAD